MIIIHNGWLTTVFLMFPLQSSEFLPRLHIFRSLASLLLDRCLTLPPSLTQNFTFSFVDHISIVC